MEALPISAPFRRVYVFTACSKCFLILMYSNCGFSALSSVPEQVTTISKDNLLRLVGYLCGLDTLVSACLEV